MRYQGPLSADIPAGWHVKDSITVLAPDGQANVIASSEPIDEGLQSGDYADAQGTILRNEFPDYEEIDFGEAAVFGDRPGYLRRFQWRPPDKGLIAQMQAYFAQTGRGYTATATVAGSELAQYESKLLSILSSLRIDGETIRVT